MDAARLVSLLRPHLHETGARWALVGGFAIVAWGSARTTFDLDLLIDDSCRQPLLARLASLGFAVLQDSDGFTNLLHSDPDFGRLDILWVEGETSRRIFAAIVEKTGPDGAPVPVPTPEHLVAMKVRAIQSRATRALRDAPDLHFLLNLPDIDENQVREYFRRANLLEIYERLRHTP